MIRSTGLGFAHAGGARMAFADVDVAQGATLLLRGASGSGKSTWLAVAAGLLVPTAGRIEVAGQVPGALRGAARDAWRGATVGFLPQRLHLSPDLSVADNLALVYLAAGLPADRAAIQRCLGAMDVATLARRRPTEISGGQAQRVALARAVLRQPAVLLADEPTASLDDAACASALDLLRHSASEVRATLVVATHDARAVSALGAAQELQLNAPAVVA